MNLRERVERRLTRSVRAFAVALLLALFALQLVHVARVDSATWDEPHHLYDGYNIWRAHDFRLNAEVPPLVKLVAALPLLAETLSTPRAEGRQQTTEAFVEGRNFVFANGAGRTLMPARYAVMIFPLLLAWLIYAAARRIFGGLAGLVALLLFTFDPTVLAFGTIVTTDLGSACCIFGTIYAFYRAMCAAEGGRRAWPWLAAAAAGAGLTVVAKFTGILLAPMLVLLVIAEAVRTRRSTTLLRGAVAILLIAISAWGIVWAFYGFRYAPAPHGLALSPAMTPYLASIPNGTGARSLGFLAAHRVLPEAYIWGLANTKHIEWEYTSYFFGKVYRHGPHLYFAAAFLIKSTLPLLILLALSVWLWRRRADRSAGARELLFLLIPVGVYMAVVMASHFDIGVRHLMPIYPFLYVLAGSAAALMLERGGRAWPVLAAGLLLWQVAESFVAWPDRMAYGNEAWGGPSRVHRYLSDANVDWGQQLFAVREYLAANDLNRPATTADATPNNCWFVYFPDGAIKPEDYGIHCHRLPTANILYWIPLPMDVPPIVDGTLLISDSDLAGIEFGDGSLNPYAQLLTRTPDAVLRHGMYVYRGRFDLALASALVEVRTSRQLADDGAKAAALAHAQHAAMLAPGSAIVQLNLADALSAAGQWSEAAAHYAGADRLAHSIRPDLQLEDLAADIAAGSAKARARLQPPTTGPAR